jgi:hypothetical protein
MGQAMQKLRPDDLWRPASSTIGSCSHGYRMKLLARRQRERRHEIKHKQEARHRENCGTALPARCPRRSANL